MCPVIPFAPLVPALMALRTLLLFPTWSTAGAFPRPLLDVLVLLAVLTVLFVAALHLRKSRYSRRRPSDDSRDMTAP